MRLLVLLAGVVDPKWALGVEGTTVIRPIAPAQGRVLGPFDQSALEVALKLRDEQPDTRIDMVVCGGPECDAMARNAAAFRPQRLCRLDVAAEAFWDARRLSVALIPFIDVPGGAPDLVLIGREFGDCDDGTLPPFLAEAWGWRFVGMVQAVSFEDDGLALRRERAGFEETVHVRGPLLASITNDKANRLRHPLLKNVMAAKRATIEVQPVRAAEDDAATVLLAHARCTQGPERGAVSCRMLAGTVDECAAELARFLAPWRRPS